MNGQQNSNINDQQQGRVTVSAAAFAAKYRSKRECYNFLAVDANVFLPAYEQVTIYFLKDLISGTKKPIYGNQVRHVTIPQYEGLTLNDIADFVTKHANVQPYLPDGKEIQKVPKAWIGNVCATILGDTFTKWISSQVEERNKKLLVEKGLAIEMDPKIAEAFYASTKTSGKFISLTS